MTSPVVPAKQDHSASYMPSAYPSDENKTSPITVHPPNATTKQTSEDDTRTEAASNDQPTTPQRSMAQRSINYPNADFDSSEDESPTTSLRRAPQKTIRRAGQVVTHSLSGMQGLTPQVTARLRCQPPKDEEVARAMGITVEELLASDSEDDH